MAGDEGHRHGWCRPHVVGALDQLEGPNGTASSHGGERHPWCQA